MTKAREVPGLRCEERFATVAAAAVGVRADELLEQSEGVLDVEQIDRVHAMRVASRRLRATMEVFEACFPRKRFRAALKEVKAIADALGERRDRDVSIATLEAFAASLTADDALGVRLMTSRLREEQQLANDRLVAFVDPARLRGLRERIGELAAAAEARP